MNTLFKGTAVNLHSSVSEENSSSTPLLAAGTFIGKWIDARGYSSVTNALRADVDGNVYIQFSPDGINVDSSLPYRVSANTNEVHRAEITRKYVRILYINGPVDQTSFRMQTMFGNAGPLVGPFNQTIGQDADCQLVKSIGDEVLIADGLLEGYSIVNKFGLNPDIDNSGNEDIWGGDGFYTGWATAAQKVEVFSSSADDAAAGIGAQTVRLTGLDANYEVISETVTLNGITGVLTTQDFLRVHTAQTLTAGSNGVNVGSITFRQAVTTTNVFLTMAAGRNQTNCSAYTIPAGYTGYLRQMSVTCSNATSVILDGNIWTRTFGSVFRSRRPFYISNNFKLVDQIFGGIVFTEKSDLVIRINTCSANNTPVNAAYDLLLVKN